MFFFYLCSKGITHDKESQKEEDTMLGIECTDELNKPE